METAINKSRVASVDAFRAITMVMMLFVNFYAGMSGIPHWMHHAAAKEDMLGLADIVFPAFLFAVGLSIPLAIGKRIDRGDSIMSIVGHIFMRSLALLVMGVFMVNLSYYSSDGAMLSYRWYEILMAVAFILIWNDYPKRWPFYILRALGVGLLVFLYFVFNGKEPFAFHWWGILGLIGWAYLFCALLYLLSFRKLEIVAAMWFFVVTACVLNWAIPGGFLGDFPLFGWTSNALCFSGVLLTVVMQKSKKPGDLILFCLIAGLVMLAAFFVSHKFWIISKIKATPTWFFVCTAMYFPFFALLYYICDVARRTDWLGPIKPAGTATLTCYLIPYIMLPVQGMLGLYIKPLYHGGLGLLNALVLTAIVIFITWLISKIGIKLRI